jgi:hypothetical protein
MVSLDEHENWGATLKKNWGATLKKELFGYALEQRF